MLDLLDALLFSTIRAATPLLLIVLGVLLTERSGVINLGQEGLVLSGAACGFVTCVATGSTWFAMLVGAGAGVVLALLFALLVLVLKTNQVASGLATTIVGMGLAAMIGSDMSGVSITGMAAWPVPWLSELPLVGYVLFQHDPIVYITMLSVPAVWWFVHRSRIGSSLAAAGHNPIAAAQLGVPVLRTRFLAILCGGALAGIAGAWLAVAYTPLWSESIAAGRGWIALALVVFAGWRVPRALAGACLFGAMSILPLTLQSTRLELSPQLLAMLPYIATLVVLIAMTRQRFGLRDERPRALGQASPPGD